MPVENNRGFVVAVALSIVGETGPITGRRGDRRCIDSVLPAARIRPALFHIFRSTPWVGFRDVGGSCGSGSGRRVDSRHAVAKGWPVRALSFVSGRV